MSTHVRKRSEELSFRPQGKITLFDSPAAHFIFNALAVIALGQEFDVINNYYFSAVVLFAAPLLFDALKLKPHAFVQTVVWIIYLFILGVTVATCIFGFMGVVSITKTLHIMVSERFVIGKGFSCDASLLWWSCVLCFFMSCVYYFATKSRAEEKWATVKSHS